MFRCAFLFFAFLPPMTAGAAPFTAFQEGEKFTYNVGYAIFGRAGEITIQAHGDKTPAGVAVMKVITTTKSKGLVRGVYAFDNVAEVVVDRQSGRLLSVKESGEDPKRATDSETIFDYEQLVAHHVDRSRPGRSTEIAIPHGAPLDLISALVQTRDWDLKPGEKRDILVHFGRDLYPLSIHAEGYEEIRTPMGSFRALTLVPRMETAPKGLFKRGGEIKVWIAQDGSRLPVKMQLKLKFGTASLLLAGYTPGTK